MTGGIHDLLTVHRHPSVGAHGSRGADVSIGGKDDSIRVGDWIPNRKIEVVVRRPDTHHPPVGNAVFGQ
jgi:hypothetical protein